MWELASASRHESVSSIRVKMSMLLSDAHRAVSLISYPVPAALRSRLKTCDEYGPYLYFNACRVSSPGSL